ncbi:hypothetical protein SSS_08196 [Sarcoptes scabiei]|uniref:Uncharacterized protein n=1 Tax=Sarcoptes scabiei TaxID=52283 RepID=A0A834RAV8_SARSC|nr:hypothetical protein SSS_08196 [Sarcoptes scabiei]UXI19229.1 beta-1 3-galactosyltransferase 5-like [Sarcoptes scabiei]
MANKKFTIINDDDSIRISKSLQEKIIKKQQHQQQNQSLSGKNDDMKFDPPKSNSRSDFESLPQSQPVYPSLYPELPKNAEHSSGDDFRSPSNYHLETMTPSSISRGYFDPNFLLLELRNEYERKLHQYQMRWHQNINEMDRLNRELINKNRDLMSTEIKRIDDAVLKKHFPTNKKSIVPNELLCKELEDKLLRCLEMNGKKSLNCSKFFHEYSRCIEESRLKLLQQE